MISNHLKIAWRVFTRRKLYGIINLVGLSIAVGFSLLVVLYVKDEFSFDKHHKESDRLFLVHSVQFKTDNLDDAPGFFDVGPADHVSKSIPKSIPFAAQVADNVPEIETLIRSEYNGTSVMKDGKAQSEGVRYVDRAFFGAFTYEFLYGSEETALKELEDVVISDEIAMKYFGKVDVLNETFRLGSGEYVKDYRISAVVKKPENSVVGLNIVLRFEKSFYYREYRDNWGQAATSLFVVLKDGAEPEVAASKIRELSLTRDKEWIDQYRDRMGLAASNPVVDFRLKPVSELYLDPTVQFGKSSSRLYSYILLSVAVIILLIACINYIAMSISLANVRSSEVALRKVMGSSRSQLVGQFYTESLLSVLLAILMGYSLMQVFLPMFNELSGKSLQMEWSDHVFAAAMAIAVTALISLVAGLYPARLMSGMSIVNGIKNQSTQRIKPTLIKSMVVFQFVLCIFFLGMGLTMHEQFRYISDKDLGFDKEQVVYVTSAWGITDKLKQKLEGNPSIVSSAGVSGIFESGGSLGRMVSNGVEYTKRRVLVDHGFIETMGFDLLQGRDFDPTRNREQEQSKVLVNETLYNLWKADSLNSKNLDKVIGVIKDFNFEALTSEIGPIQFELYEPEYISVMYARLDGNRVKEGVQVLQAAFNELKPSSTAEVSFLDEYVNSRYKNMDRWSQIVDLAAIITILIAVSGLFGLTAINVMNRMKEMGIRKVLGANLKTIMILLNRQTFGLLFVSMAISFPLWYYFAGTWVESFAYHINVNIGLFILATVLCMVVVIGTVSFHGFRTSRIDPTQLLRDE